MGFQPIDLGREHRVGRAREYLLGHRGVERAERGGAMFDVLKRDMRVALGATDKDGRLQEIYAIAGDIRRPDERAAQRGDKRITARMARGVFENETRALGKSGERDAFRRDAGSERLGHERIDDGKGAGQPRLVIRGRNEEAVRIPGVVRRLGSEVGEIDGVKNIGESGNVFGGRTASVDKDHDATGLRQRRAKTESMGGIVEVHGI